MILIVLKKYDGQYSIYIEVVWSVYEVSMPYKMKKSFSNFVYHNLIISKSIWM